MAFDGYIRLLVDICHEHVTNYIVPTSLMILSCACVYGAHHVNDFGHHDQFFTI